MMGMSEQTFDQSSLRQFSVKPSESGSRSVVHLAGQDISRHITGLQVDMSSGGVADVLLHVADVPHPEIDVLARVVVADEPDIATAVTRFLSAIDPAALEEAALNRDDLGRGPGSLTKSMLTQLIDWANGRS